MNNEIVLKPFFNRLFVKRDETNDKTAGGLIIPETDKERPNKGIVIAAGPDCKFSYTGQRIVFGQHQGVDVVVDGVNYTILREEDIYAGEERPKADVIKDLQQLQADHI